MKKPPLELNRVDLLHDVLLFFVGRVGESNVGSFGLSMPGSASVRLLDVEFDFAGYRDRCLRKHFRQAIWTVERQKQTKDWHIHALVDVGFNIQTGFPFEEVKARDYRHVPGRVRELWKALRDAAAETGYGVSNILPEGYGGSGIKPRLVSYNRPYLMPIKKGASDRLVSYLSGRPLSDALKSFDPPPEGCGSWG